MAVIILFLSVLPCRAADPLRENFENGYKAYNSGDYEKAVAYYEKVVEINPDFAPVYVALAQAYQELKAPLSDLEWFYGVALDINPDYVEVYDNMCRMYYRATKFDLAEQSCLDALKINPNLGSAELTLGWVYLAGKSEPAKAIYYFNRVLDKVKNPLIYFGLGMAYSMNGERAQVLDVVTKLRGMGEEELAGQLENTLRTYVDVQPVEQRVTQLPQRQPGQIISAGTDIASAPPPVSPPTGASGQMTIRLRGQLSGGPAGPQQHPGAMSEDAGSTYRSGGSSAIERIRRLQLLRQQGYNSQTVVTEPGY